MPGSHHVHIPPARLVPRLLATLAMSLALFGCGDDNTSEPPDPLVPVATVSIVAVPDYLTVGQSIALTAELRAADGTALADRIVAWTSDNSALATVNNAGVVTALAPGVVAIRASSEGRTARIDARIFEVAAAPAIASLQPSSVVVGTAGPLVVRVLGADFSDRSRIFFDGQERNTLFVSPTELRTTLVSTQLAITASASVSVRTPAPGGGESNATTFSVIEIPPSAPSITALAPAHISAGWALGFTLTVTGENFTPSTRILWDGVARETHYASATTVRVQISPADVLLARDVPIIAETPAPGGGRDTAVFQVRAIAVDRVDLQSPFGGSWTWVNNALPLIAVPRSATGAPLSDRRAHWTTDAATVASIVPTGDLSAAVYGVQRGVASIESDVEGVRVQRTISVYDAPPFDVVFSSGFASEQYIGIWSPSIGEAPRRLHIPLTAFSPSPSPTGEHIVFAGTPREGSVPDANFDLYVVARDGSGLRRLTTNAEVDYQPSWSPDGTRIAFASMRGGNRNVWVINSDGTDPRRLTDAQPDALHLGSGSSAGDPAWSPDGARLVYGVTVGNKTSLWIMDADGANKRALTESMDGSAYDPSWSPDGQVIGFRREFGNPQQIALTFVSATDGATVFPLMSSAPMSASPAFSPDGQWLMASNTPLGDTATLYAAPLTVVGGARVILPTSLGGARSARWIRRPGANASVGASTEDP